MKEEKKPGPLTRESYALLLDALRANPGKTHLAAKIAGVHHNTAKAAWARGLRPSWAREPISEIVDRESMLAAQMMATGRVPGAEPGASPPVPPPPPGSPAPPTTAYDTAAIAQNNHAAAVRTQEGLLVRTTRANLISLASMTAKMLQTLRPLWENYCLQLSKTKPEDLLKNGDQLLKLLRAMNLSVKEHVAAGEEIVDLERKTLGNAESNELSEMTLEQAAAHIATASEALKKARELGIVSELPASAIAKVSTAVASDTVQ